MTDKGSNGALGAFRVQIVLGLHLIDDGFAEMRSGRPTKAPHGQQFFHEEPTGLDESHPPSSHENFIWPVRSIRILHP